MMRPLTLSSDQRLPNLLDATSETVRSAMDAAEALNAWGGRILETAPLTRNQRQALWDLRRAHRRDAINRSPFGLLFELASLAPFDVATYGPALFKVEIVGRGSYVLPSEDEAHQVEERSNHLGNLAQLRRIERKTASTRYDVVDTMNAQSVASDTLALTTAVGR